MSRMIVSAALAVLVGCEADAVPPAPAQVTWYQDVAPIAARHCMTCHRPDGIGPFDLTSYDVAAARAQSLLDKIRSGEMPPFGAREAPDCTPRFGWVDDQRLSAAEIDTLQQWIDDGVVAGTPAALPAIPDPSLSGVTTTLVPDTPFTASGSQDEFICYVLDPQITTLTWLDGLQVVPGNPSVVHHVVVSELGPGAEKDMLVSAHGIGKPYTCGPVPGAFAIHVWTPGNLPFQTSEKLAVPVGAGAVFVLNIHYHPTGLPAAPDQTALALRVATTWPEKMFFVGGFGNASAAPDLLSDPDDRNPPTPEFRIPANKPNHGERMHISVSLPYNLQEVKLYSVSPHMHMIGTRVSAWVTRPEPRGSDPQSECLANDAWNFDWQRTYVYDTPLDQLPTLRPGDVFDLSCTWDNTMTNPFVQRLLHDAGRVVPYDIALGQTSIDEMCLEFFGFVIDAPAQP